MDSYIFDGNAAPDSLAREHKRRIVSSLMAPPVDMGSGLAAMGDALQYRQSRFPEMPGGGKPSLAMRFGSLFGMGGGLY
jgi:hypothetical protein